MRRRQLLKSASQAFAAAAVGAPRLLLAQGSRDLPSTLRFGTTPVFLDDQVAFLTRWGDYLSGVVGMKVQFVQRRSYRDVMGLLRAQEIEAAWICGYPWVLNRRELRGLSLPLYAGEPWYRSYLVVAARDTTTMALPDLRGKIFAYSDPDSNSGYLVPRTTLLRAAIDPERHFARSFFTWGHRNVVRAVAEGLADGGAVDGYVWETLKLHAPDLVGKTRVAWQSPKFGFPPLVVPSSLPVEVEVRLRDALLGMGSTANGRSLLNELNLSGFGRFQPEVFSGIAELAAMVGQRAT